MPPRDEWQQAKREGLEALSEAASELNDVIAQLDRHIGQVKTAAQELDLSEERQQVADYLDGFAHHRRELEHERKRVTELMRRLRAAGRSKAVRLGEELQRRAGAASVKVKRILAKASGWPVAALRRDHEDTVVDKARAILFEVG